MTGPTMQEMIFDFEFEGQRYVVAFMTDEVSGGQVYDVRRMVEGRSLGGFAVDGRGQIGVMSLVNGGMAQDALRRLASSFVSTRLRGPHP